jgi:hypothetical protein
MGKIPTHLESAETQALHKYIRVLKQENEFLKSERSHRQTQTMKTSYA